MTNHPNEGSRLDDLLAEDGLLHEATSLACKRVIAWQIAEEMRRIDLTKSEMAARMGTTRRQVDRLLDPDNGNVTLETLQRAAAAIDRTIRLELA